MRLRSILKSKIHRATVTEADVDYVGSVTIDRSLIERVDLLPNEHVHIWNVSNGERFETYVIEAEPGSGTIRINGAGAHKAKCGDVVIIAAFMITDEPITPKVILVNEQNEFVKYL